MEAPLCSCVTLPAPALPLLSLSLKINGCVYDERGKDQEMEREREREEVECARRSEAELVPH